MHTLPFFGLVERVPDHACTEAMQIWELAVGRTNKAAEGPLPALARQEFCLRGGADVSRKKLDML